MVMNNKHIECGLSTLAFIFTMKNIAVTLVKFGAVLSIICGFLMAVYI